jgi:hypothetical protein
MPGSPPISDGSLAAVILQKRSARRCHVGRRPPARAPWSSCPGSSDHIAASAMKSPAACGERPLSAGRDLAGRNAAMAKGGGAGGGGGSGGGSAQGSAGGGESGGSWTTAPPSNAAIDAARTLVERDSQRLGLVGPPLSRARERDVIAGRWRYYPWRIRHARLFSPP